MPNIEELMIQVFDGEVRTLASLWETIGPERTARFARDKAGIGLGIMEDFPDPLVPTQEQETLEAELAILLRKMWQRNLYVQETADRIIRGLRYDETAKLPPPCDRH